MVPILFSVLRLVALDASIRGSNSWDNGVDRIVDFGRRDSFDYNFELTGIGESEEL